MILDTKRLAKEIADMLVAGAKLRWPRSFEMTKSYCAEIVAFCEERANNLAQAMPELIRECMTETPSEIRARVDLYNAATIARVVGLVQPNAETLADDLDNDARQERDEIRPEDEAEHSHHSFYSSDALK